MITRIKPASAGALLAVALSFALWAPAARAGAQDFTIPTFEGDYYLSRDASHISHLRVHEHLVASFPETNQNHGILRALPELYENHSLNLSIQSVTDDSGQKLSYSKSTSNHNLILKIGDTGRYVHGLQPYNIDYTMDNVTTAPPGADGHFWDVNGDQWPQQFGQVTARLHLTSDLAPAAEAGAARCFTGPHGSTAAACTITTSQGPGGDTSTTFTATRPLEPNETLTYEMRFTAGTFAPYALPTDEIIRLAATIIFLYLLPLLLTLAIVIRQWLKYGRDPKGRGVIIPQYLPLKDLSVLGASALIHESFVPTAVSAQIIDLAVRRYLKIYEVKQPHPLLPASTGYEIELVRAPDKLLRSEERATIDLLFPAGAAPGARVNLDSLKHQLTDGAKDLGKSVNQRLTTAGYFRTEPSRAKLPYLVIGTVLLIASFYFLPHSLGILLSGVILLLAANVMPARTRLGVDTRDYLLGLKEYMKLAETDRIKALQSPHGELTEKIDVSDTTALIKLSEKLLPYAMLFDIEKDWAREFASLYAEAPGWYSGSSSFSAGYFAGSMSNFNTVSAASFTPSSSSSSGGFSGGGGGGGGGGGW